MPHSRCRACGFVFANPIPDGEALYAFYNSSFYSNYRRLEEHRLSRERYFSISMYTDMRRLASWLGQDKSLSILDYGCGPGAFIALLRDEFGFSNVEGIEVNRESITIAERNFGLRIASSKDELHHQPYDCVLLLEVIEHIPLPDVFLEEIGELIKPGGRVLITTPAVDNLVSLLLPLHGPHYTAPSHISLFTKKALSELLYRFGFKIERFEIDESIQIMERSMASLFYDLDFMSPSNDNDASDALATPNALGRLLRRKPRRQFSLGRIPFYRVDQLLVRLSKLIPSIPRNNHLYVLARKDGSA
jgi:2-polyprenyl-3-methyl-5-hydroxy-6-metoxy-1,4-benzoquinol methylase